MPTDAPLPTAEELAREADRVAAWAEEHGLAAVRDLTPTAVMLRRLVAVVQGLPVVDVEAVMDLVDHLNSAAEDAGMHMVDAERGGSPELTEAQTRQQDLFASIRAALEGRTP